MINGIQSPRPTSSNNFASYVINNFTIKNVLIILPLLILLLTIFFLQWHGSSTEQLTRLPLDQPVKCGTSAPPAGVEVNSSASNEVEKLFDLSRLIGWKLDHNGSFVGPKICITSTTSAGLEDILQWIFYHKVVGITNFFLFVEGKAANPNVCQVLEAIPGVKTIRRTREFEEQQAKSRIWNETWLADAFHKPCNHALFVKQTLNMEMGIVMARDAGMQWILHLDTDELLHPAGSRDYSVTELFANVPSDVDTLVFLNHESAVESDDVKEPFSEVSLFKRNLFNLPTNNSEFSFRVWKEATRPDNPSYFLTYGNGKSAARIEDNLRPNGAHRWHNYMKEPKEMQIKEAIVLHYTYSRFSALTSRRNRCNCNPTPEDVKRCFYLQFDRNAFIIASTSTQEEMLRWYQEHVVWSDETIKQRLLNFGILTRIYTPMFIIHQLTKSKDYVSIVSSTQTNTTSKSLEVSNMGNNSFPNNNINGLFHKHVGENEDYYSHARPLLSPPDSNKH